MPRYRASYESNNYVSGFGPPFEAHDTIGALVQAKALSPDWNVYEISVLNANLDWMVVWKMEVNKNGGK